MLTPITTYHVLPAREIATSMRAHLDALFEYDLDLDYLISLLTTAPSVAREVGIKYMLNYFRGEFGVVVESDFYENADFTTKLDNDIGLMAGVVDTVIDLLEIIYTHLCPCFNQLAEKIANVTGCNFNFIRWIGDDIMIAATYHRNVI